MKSIDQSGGNLMKTKKYLFHTAALVLILVLQFAWGPATPAAVAKVSTNLDEKTLYLPLVSGGGGGGSAGNDLGRLWLPFAQGDGSIRPSYGASLAVDSSGGIHVVYSIYTGTDENGQKPATYAHCSAYCGDKTSWTFAHLGEAVQDARIDLDPSGRPRMLLFGPVDDPNWPRMRYQYAACDAGCANAASWTITTIATPIEPTGTREYNNNRYFAIDQQGRPAFVYTDTNQNNHPGTYYMSCQTACINANQWTETTLSSSNLFDKVSLAFSPGGGPRLAFGYFDENQDLYLSYAQCDQDCTNGASWSGTALVQIHGSAKFNLAVDSNGRPRLGVYSGSYGYAPFPSQKLLYLWCNTACNTSSSWFFSDIGMASGSGDGVDLALDGQDRPRLSFETASQGLGYAWCNAACESGSAVWQSQVVESQESLADNYEVLPIHRCTISTWFNGQRSSLALDASGNPRIAYDAQHWWYGTEDVGGVPQPCNYQDVTVTRISIINQP
jgi:hypothetical protein